MYAKFINEDIIQKAPVNKNGIFNYNLNIKLLKKDGYKQVIELEKPSEFIKPTQKYKELEDRIEKYWIDLYIKPSLEDLKKQKRNEINKARDSAEQGGFEYMGKIFDSDLVSSVRIQGAAQLASQMPMSDTPVIEWTCKDNSHIMLTTEELLGLSAALAQWSNECHKKATELKQQIEACQTKEELEQIKW